jgi:hypothetical protein
MKRLLLALPLVLFALACDRKPENGVKTVTAEQVADWMKTNSALVLDANGEDFRQQNGVVPGAVLLANYLDWDPATTLGPDKNRQLVFYCSNRL